MIPTTTAIPRGQPEEPPDGHHQHNRPSNGRPTLKKSESNGKRHKGERSAWFCGRKFVVATCKTDEVQTSNGSARKQKFPPSMTRIWGERPGANIIYPRGQLEELLHWFPCYACTKITSIIEGKIKSPNMHCLGSNDIGAPRGILLVIGHILLTKLHNQLLSALHNNPSLLPNKVGACWIIPFAKCVKNIMQKRTNLEIDILETSMM